MPCHCDLHSLAAQCCEPALTCLMKQCPAEAPVTVTASSKSEMICLQVAPSPAEGAAQAHHQLLASLFPIMSTGVVIPTLIHVASSPAEGRSPAAATLLRQHPGPDRCPAHCLLGPAERPEQGHQARRPGVGGGGQGTAWAQGRPGETGCDRAVQGAASHKFSLPGVNGGFCYSQVIPG